MNITIQQLEEIFAKRITKLSKERKLARTKLDYSEVNYYNGRIDELRFTFNKITEAKR